MVVIHSMIDERPPWKCGKAPFGIYSLPFEYCVNVVDQSTFLTVIRQCFIFHIISEYPNVIGLPAVNRLQIQGRP